MCQDFLDNQQKKIKPATKIKRLKKYINTEFELQSTSAVGSAGLPTLQGDNEYTLETIPKYLFQ